MHRNAYISFAACGSSDDGGDNAGGDANAAGAKTGYAVVSSIADVEFNNLSRTLLRTCTAMRTFAVIDSCNVIFHYNCKTLTIDSVVAAVLVDADGKIVSLKVDEMQIKPDLGTDDGSVADLRSKLEKKEDYNMKGASPIEKEWYEQIVSHVASGFNLEFSAV